MLKVVASCGTLSHTGSLLGVTRTIGQYQAWLHNQASTCCATGHLITLVCIRDTWLHNKDAILIPKIVVSRATLHHSLARDNNCIICLHKQLLASFPGPFKQAWDQGYTSCATSYKDAILFAQDGVSFISGTFDYHIVHHKQVLHSCSSILVRDTGSGY